MYGIVSILEVCGRKINLRLGLLPRVSQAKYHGDNMDDQTIEAK